MAIPFLFVVVIAMDIHWNDRVVTEMAYIYILNKAAYILHKKINAAFLKVNNPCSNIIF